MRRRRRPEFSPAAALDLRFRCDDLNRWLTIREYLIALLDRLWDELEGFSGKRPFGNSGWEYTLAVPLIENGFVNGIIDADGYVEEIDWDEFHGFVKECIKELAHQSQRAAA